MVGSSGFAAASYHPLYLEMPVIPNEAERNEESHHIVCENDGIPHFVPMTGFTILPILRIEAFGQ
jgi:hypothetical protein